MGIYGSATRLRLIPLCGTAALRPRSSTAHIPTREHGSQHYPLDRRILILRRYGPARDRKRIGAHLGQCRLRERPAERATVRWRNLGLLLWRNLHSIVLGLVRAATSLYTLRAVLTTTSAATSSDWRN